MPKINLKKSLAIIAVSITAITGTVLISDKEIVKNIDIDSDISTSTNYIFTYEEYIDQVNFYNKEVKKVIDQGQEFELKNINKESGVIERLNGRLY